MDTLCHQIIEFLSCRDSKDADMFNVYKDLSERFPCCHFQFHINKDIRRLSVTYDFCRYWFKILDEDIKNVSYLTCEYLR